MAKTGYDTTIKYFREILPQKQEKIKAIYGEILATYKKIEYYLVNRNYKEGRFLAADILGNLAQSSVKIDKSLFLSLVEFKKVIDNNYIVKNSIFGKKETLIQYSKVFGACSKIISELNEKFVV